MAFASASTGYAPMGEINTTPLIDVLLVLLIVFVMSIPVATQEVPIDLPQGPPPARFPVDTVKNKIGLTPDGTILWNGGPVSREELFSQIQATRLLPIEPELQFEPDALASYDLSAQVLNLVQHSGATKFGFVGNDKYREFAR